MRAEFDNIFSRLREILRKYAGVLSVTADTPTHFCLEGGRHPTHHTPLPVAWVRTGKAYVSFHHMGVYAFPKLLDDCSPRLRARMQGKSCFNFKVTDEALFKELEGLTAKAFAAFRQPGFLP